VESAADAPAGVEANILAAAETARSLVRQRLSGPCPDLFGRLLGQRGARAHHLRGGGGVAVQLSVDELADERFDFTPNDRLEQVAPLSQSSANQLVQLHGRSVPRERRLSC
jgi:hypothetical protein